MYKIIIFLKFLFNFLYKKKLTYDVKFGLITTEESARANIYVLLNYNLNKVMYIGKNTAYSWVNKHFYNNDRYDWQCKSIKKKKKKEKQKEIINYSSLHEWQHWTLYLLSLHMFRAFTFWQYLLKSLHPLAVWKKNRNEFHYFVVSHQAEWIRFDIYFYYGSWVKALLCLTTKQAQILLFLCHYTPSLYFHLWYYSC